MPEARRLQHRITSGFIQVVANNGNIPAFWAHPQYGGPFPGLVLLHDDRGLGKHMRGVVHRFAQEGYYVIAPDLFEGRRPVTKAEADALEQSYMQSGPDKVAAALHALETHHKSNRKMAVVGWDFGGTLAFNVAAQRTDVMATVSFYGNPYPFLGHFDAMTAPILAFFGEQDEILADVENTLREELIRTGKPHEVVVYPKVGHGFYNDELDSYDENAAHDAWRQMLAFLETYQGKPPAPESAQSDRFQPGRFY